MTAAVTATAAAPWPDGVEREARYLLAWHNLVGNVDRVALELADELVADRRRNKTNRTFRRDAVERVIRERLRNALDKATLATDADRPVYAVLAPPPDAGRPWQVRGLWRDGKEQRG